METTGAGAASRADITAAMDHALRAPSILNTQPWKWRIHGDTVLLYADRERHLVAYDPHRRAMVLSCGAALHHLKVALAGRGLAVHIERPVDPEDVDHLATVTVLPGPPDADSAALYPEIERRRSDRRRMSHRPVPAELLTTLAARVRDVGVVLIPAVGAVRRQLWEILSDVTAHRRLAPDAAAELRHWTHRYTAGHDGISAADLVLPHGFYDRASRLTGPGTADDAAELLVIATVDDTPPDWLRAGEATSELLLAATGVGLATTPLTLAVEDDVTRARIQQQVLHMPEHPQIVIRLGWPASGASEIPATARRGREWVVRPD